MAFRLGLGQYLPARSALHALDARIKLPGILAVIVGVFCVSTPVELAVAAAVTLALVAASRLPARRLAATLRPMLALLAVLSLFNLAFVRTGEVVAVLGPLTLTSGGVWAAALYTARFALALMAGSLVLATTTPTQLADALDSLLSPLSRLGLPAHELAMVFSLMLRFVPLLADEASALLDAQAMRGGGLGEGGLTRRVRSIVPVVVALLASGLRHADNLARALDARCYEGGAARTHWRERRIGATDIAFALACCAWLILLAVLRVLGV